MYLNQSDSKHRHPMSKTYNCLIILKYRSKPYDIKESIEDIKTSATI